MTYVQCRLEEVCNHAEERQRGVKFIDITDWPDTLKPFVNRVVVSYPTTLAHNETVSKLNAQLKSVNIRRNLDMFTSFNNRYYQSVSGNLSAEWLFGQASGYPVPRSPVSVSIFPHAYRQSSIIATIPGKSNKTIVVGAHQDSINGAAGLNKTTARAPGAG